MSFFSSAKAKLAASKLAEEQLYAQAAEEVASGQIRQGLWAKAIAETGGDEAAAKANYLKLRVEIMKAETDFSTATLFHSSQVRTKIPPGRSSLGNQPIVSVMGCLFEFTVMPGFVVPSFFSPVEI